MTDCIFCKIVNGEIPAKIVSRNTHAVAFHDLNPQAPTHVLVIPSVHIGSSAEAVGSDGERTMGQLMRMAVEVAADLGLQPGGYRFVMNTGRDGGQSVDHMHLHVLGGRPLRWPPG